MTRTRTRLLTLLRVSSGLTRQRPWARVTDSTESPQLPDRFTLTSATAVAGGEVIINSQQAFIASFDQAETAVAAAIAIQRSALEQHSDQQDAVNVRIALHTGTVAVDSRLPTDAASRELAELLEATEYGQTLISAATAALVGDCLPTNYALEQVRVLQGDGGDGSIRAFQLRGRELPDVGVPPISPGRHEGDVRPSSVEVPFVGRDAITQKLRESLERAVSGTGSIVLLSGEPGIGKTSLAEQISNVAKSREVGVVWGNCFEWAAAPAFWPWTQALGDLLRHVDDQLISGLDPETVEHLARVVPALDARAERTAKPPNVELESQLIQLLVAVGSLLREVTRQRSIMIVLDDIHWADVPSLQLLRFLSHELRDLPVLILATYRDTEVTRSHPAWQIIADLVRNPHGARFVLTGLPKPQVARIVASATGRSQSHLIDTVFEETDGNPLFVTELLRMYLEDDGTVELEGGRRRISVPVSVREAVLRRLDRLDARSVEVLSLASVIGRDFDVHLMQLSSDESANTLLEALQIAADAQFIRAGEDPAGFRFSHALVQKAIYEEIPPGRRTRLHLAVADALEAMFPVNPPWAELAHHVYGASSLIDPKRIVTVADQAAQAAMRQFDWTAAATHYQHALAALDRSVQADPVRRCDVLLELGEALNRSGPGSGDAPLARERFLESFQLAQAAGDGERMARAAVGFAGLNMVAAFGGHQQLELLEAALAAMDTSDSPARVRVSARLGVDLFHRSMEDTTRGVELSDNAVSMAVRLDDATLLGYALWAKHSSGFNPENLDERLTVSARLVELSETSRDPHLATWGYLLRSSDCIEAGDLFQAEEAIAWLRQFDERVSIPYIANRVAAWEACLDLLKGEYAMAIGHIERARTLWQSESPSQYQFQPFILLRDLGRFEEFTDEIRLPDRAHPWRSAAQAYRMTVAEEQGRRSDAQVDYELLVADDLHGIPFNRQWLITMTMLGEMSVALDDSETAAKLIRRLAAYSDRIAIDGSLVISHGPVALYLGRLSTYLVCWEDAQTWLEQSLEMSSRLGLKPFVARSLLAQATLFVKRGRSGESTRARKVIEQAIEVASEIGMHDVVAHANALRESISRHASRPFGLTPREMDVLRLVVEGKSDREIADALYISHHTVMRHVSHILGKLDVESRTAATSRAVRLQIV